MVNGKFACVVHTYYQNSRNTSRKTYNSRGARTHAAKYALSQMGYGAELVDWQVMLTLLREDSNADWANATK